MFGKVEGVSRLHIIVDKPERWELLYGIDFSKAKVDIDLLKLSAENRDSFLIYAGKKWLCKYKEMNAVFDAICDAFSKAGATDCIVMCDTLYDYPYKYFAFVYLYGQKYIEKEYLFKHNIRNDLEIPYDEVIRSNPISEVQNWLENIGAEKACKELAEQEKVVAMAQDKNKAKKDGVNQNEMIIEGDVLYSYSGRSEIVTVPEGVRQIADNAFSSYARPWENKNGLVEVILPDSVCSISKDAFANVKFLSGSGWGSAEKIRKMSMPLKMNMPKDYLKQSEGLDTSMAILLLDTVWKNEKNIENLAYLFANYGKRQSVIDYVMPILKENPDKSITFILQAYEGSEKPNFTSFIEFLVVVKEKISQESLDQACSFILENGGKTAYKALVNAELIEGNAQDKEQKEKKKEVDDKKLQSGERPDESIIEAYVDEYLKNNEIAAKAREAIKVYKIPYRNSSINCKAEVLEVLLNCFIQINNEYFFKGLTKTEESENAVLRVCEIPDYIASFLDEEALSKWLLKLIKGKDFQSYILACARYLTENEAQNYISLMNTKSKAWAVTAKRALLLNDTSFVIRYFEGEKIFEKYANMRGMTTQEVKTTKPQKNLGIAKTKEQAKTEKESQTQTKEQEELIYSAAVERSEEDEIIRFSEEYWKKHTIKPVVLECVAQNKKIHYRNSHMLCDVNVLHILLNEYAEEFEAHSNTVSGMYNSHRELRSGFEIKISEDADRVFGYLNEEELYVLLQKLSHSKEYRYFIISYARFIPESHVSDFISEIKKQAKGNAKAKYWADNARKALYINESVETMKFFDSQKELDSYARKRGMTAQEIRDLKMAPDFGFDESGVKHFSAGDIHLSVSVFPDTSLELYDEIGKKVIKSIPKKGASDQELEELKKDINDFKKTAKKYVDEKIKNLASLHMNGIAINHDVWEKVYLDNPLIKPLAKGLIWVDEDKNTFIPIEKGFSRSDGTPYSTNSKVHLAHVVDMEEHEIAAWQTYLLQAGVSQPFEQIWEPVMDLSKVDISCRYNGLCITSKERNALKKRLKAKGIDVRSDEMEAVFDHRKGVYEFDDYNKMHMGEYVTFDYKIEADKSIVITSGEARNTDVLTRSLNSIVYEMEKLAIKKHIEEDDDSSLVASILAEFTVAQIIDFINIAAENQSIKCSAVLLNYKNEFYQGVDPLESLSLDLL